MTERPQTERSQTEQRSTVRRSKGVVVRPRASGVVRDRGGVSLLLACMTGRAKRPHTDETRVALASRIPEWALLFVGFVCLAFCWRYLVRGIRAPRVDRRFEMSHVVTCQMPLDAREAERLGKFPGL